MTNRPHAPTWAAVGVLAGRWIFAAAFLVSVAFKLKDIDGTALYIASAGFPAPKLLAWLAASFELALVACFMTGAFFAEAALFAAAYVMFLGFVFHGPAHWSGNPMEFGLFVNHWTFMAGLLFAAAHGPGTWLASGRGYVATRMRA